ncbi:MAG: hypothetical protein EZS28_034390, partial [Streblomastix strix]
MLVSSLVNQTELQEVRDITSGKSKASVFDTQPDLNDRMEIQDNVAKLAINDNQYIFDKYVMVYWLDSSDLKILETEQPDMANVITTVGAATDGVEDSSYVRHIARFRIGTTRIIMINIYSLSGEAGRLAGNQTAYINATYLAWDERLLDAAGLSDFPELYAYTKECYPKPLEHQQQLIPQGEQTQQQQMKNNDNIIYGSGDSNEEFEPSVSNAITKLDLSSYLERQSFQASSDSDPQLIVYGDRITLTASYATTGVFPN